MSEKVVSLSNLARFKSKCDDKYRMYRHYIALEIDGSNFLSFSITNSSPTPLTDFSKLSNALAYNNSYGGAIGGGYFDDDYGCSYAVSTIDINFLANPTTLSFEYYVGSNVSNFLTITPSRITAYIDNVAEV